MKIIERPRDAVWTASVPELGKHYFVINNLDKASGLINVSYSGDPERYIDVVRPRALGATHVARLLARRRLRRRGHAPQGFDLQRTQYDDHGWRATFYTTGTDHSPTSATGTAWERTPWRATHRAAWDALNKAEAALPA